MRTNGRHMPEPSPDDDAPGGVGGVGDSGGVGDAGGVIDLAVLDAAAARLRDGGVVAFPTETVYGLGADARRAASVERVFALKGRPANNPVIVHVTGPSMACEVVASGAWDARAEALARAFWPGPLSMVLPRGAAVPGVVTAGGPGVAVRAPNHPVALALLFAFGGPLVGPSANRSGGVSPTRASHVREAFGAGDVLTLDGGACATGIESTVVSLLGARAVILRPGVIGAEALSEALGETVDAGDGADDGGSAGPLASPGRLAVHYAPRTRAVLVDHDEVEEWLEDVGRVAIISHALTQEDVSPHVLIRMPGMAGAYAAGLYAALREADGAGAEVIVIVRPPRGAETAADTAIWRAVHDRLARATHPRDINP